MELNGPGRSNLERKKFLAEGEAHMGCLTPSLKGRTFEIRVLNRGVFNFCVRSIPLRRTIDVLQGLRAVYASLRSHVLIRRKKKQKKPR